jgi:hypothetical protein
MKLELHTRTHDFMGGTCVDRWEVRDGHKLYLLMVTVTLGGAGRNMSMHLDTPYRVRRERVDMCGRTGRRVIACVKRSDSSLEAYGLPFYSEPKVRTL